MMESSQGHAEPTLASTVLLVAGYLGVLFLLDGTKDLVAVLGGRGPRGPLGFLTDAVPWWGVWGPLMFLGLRGALRVAPDRVGWGPSIVWNLAGSALLVLTHLLLVSLIFDMMSGPADGMAISQRVRRLGTIFLMPELLTIWGAVALLYSFSLGARLQARDLEAMRLRAAMSEARLERLKREISPHFLFNALNSVSGLVREGRRAAASDMLDSLATLLRRSLERDPRTEIPLEEELGLLDQYVQVEQARWGDALTVEMRVEEGLESAAVPPMILQPLVENAIRHGLRPGGRIAVDADERAGRLRLVVADPGGGGQGGTSSGFGIGLSNTRERLACLYGGEADLVVETPAHRSGTSVRVSIPLKRLDPAPSPAPVSEGAPSG